MIESVSTSPVQSVALRSSPQSANPFSSSTPAPASNFISSRVRVDNLLNAAILEYRNSSGDVVAQYPTQAQIQAFHRAERLAQNHAQDAHLEHLSAPTSSTGGSAGGQGAAASAPDSSAPAPSTSDIVAAAASYSPPAAPGSSSTLSTTA